MVLTNLIDNGTDLRKGVALVFGLGGQDGSYMCELLLEKGWVGKGWGRRVTRWVERVFERVV